MNYKSYRPPQFIISPGEQKDKEALENTSLLKSSEASHIEMKFIEKPKFINNIQDLTAFSSPITSPKETVDKPSFLRRKE